MPSTHCPHGHELTDANSFRANNGTYQCRACSRLNSLGCQLQRMLGLPDRQKIEQQAKRLVERQATQDRERAAQQLAKTLTPEPPALPKVLNAVDLAVTATQQRKPQARTADAAFHAAMQERIALYKQDGLDALRDLAMMPISTNSMQNQVKFLAASKLVGNMGEQGGPSTATADTLLAQLKDEYTKAAPKIREVRERVITFDEPKAIN